MKKLLITLIALAAIFAIYWFGFRMTKVKAIKIITENGMNKENKDLAALPEAFLFAWAKAIKKAEVNFITGGKTYKVQGGNE